MNNAYMVNLLVILACSILPEITGFNLYDDDKRQDMIPIPRVGRTPSYFGDRLTEMNYKRQGLIPFPRVGRSSEEDKRQDLIPFPRVGRRSVAQEFGWSDVPQDLGQFPNYFMFPYNKRAPFTPRLGRKKRSVDGLMDNLLGSNSKNPDSKDSDNHALADLADKLEDSPWAIVAWKSEKSKDQEDQPLKTASTKPGPNQVRRATFSPRLGRSEYNHQSDRDNLNIFEPRPGRSPFTPRMGRSAPYSPRLGRSTDNVEPESD